MNKFWIILFLFLLIPIVEANGISSPPPLPDSPPALQAYLQEIYNNIKIRLLENVLYKNLQTTDATVTDILTISVSEGEVYRVEAKVIGRKSDGTDRAFYYIAGLFYRNTGGNVTQEGSTTSLVSLESNASWNADLVADTTNQTIDVRVTGVAATTITWKAYIKYMKVT